MVVPLAMGWRDLLLENWQINPVEMESHLPPALTLDTFDGDAWLSVIPFVNIAVRPRGVPASLGTRIPELNVRTYVSYDGYPGVYFFSLDADGLATVLGARLLHWLPYYYASISVDRQDVVQFRSQRRHPGARAAMYELTYQPSSDPYQAHEDPLAEFLFERYRLFTESPDGSIRYTSVTHKPWVVQTADASVETNTIAYATGFDVAIHDPVRYYSSGVDVVAHPSRTID